MTPHAFCRVRSPSALDLQIRGHFADKYSDEAYELAFGLLYSVVALPSILLCLIGGHLVDRIGFAPVLIACMLTIVCGQV